MGAGWSGINLTNHCESRGLRHLEAVPGKRKNVWRTIINKKKNPCCIPYAKGHIKKKHNFVLYQSIADKQKML